MPSKPASFSDALNLLDSEIQREGDTRLYVINEVTSFFAFAPQGKQYQCDEAMALLFSEAQFAKLWEIGPRKFVLKKVVNLLRLAEKTTKIRSTSNGIDGTYANVEHHALAVEPIIAILISHFVTLQPEIKKWVQGHNIHVIHSMDDRKLSFRPFSDDTGIVGVQVALRMSRSSETRLQFIESEIEAIQFGSWLAMFLDFQANFYGQKRTSGHE